MCYYLYCVLCRIRDICVYVSVCVCVCVGVGGEGLGSYPIREAYMQGCLRTICRNMSPGYF